MGINGIMKESFVKPLFSGSYDDYLNDFPIIYDTLDEIRDVIPDKKRKSMPLILKEYALYLFSHKASNCTIFEDSANQLGTWYNSS